MARALDWAELEPGLWIGQSWEQGSGLGRAGTRVLDWAELGHAVLSGGGDGRESCVLEALRELGTVLALEPPPR